MFSKWKNSISGVAACLEGKKVDTSDLIGYSILRRARGERIRIKWRQFPSWKVNCG